MLQLYSLLLQAPGFPLSESKPNSQPLLHCNRPMFHHTFLIIHHQMTAISWPLMLLLGAFLSVEQGSVVEFASWTLIFAKQKYTTTEKECLAILWASQKFRHYKIRAHFTLEANHRRLEWLDSSRRSQACSQCLERWSLELRAYNFTVVHHPGNCWCSFMPSNQPGSFKPTTRFATTVMTQSYHL